MIQAKINLINSEFKDISTSWTILTAVDFFNFDTKKVIPVSKSNILDDLEINKNNKSFKERIDFIKNLKKIIFTQKWFRCHVSNFLINSLKITEKIF